ncbi:unnamed protein product [Rotaria sp. Silwood2]|nr:unnamed protein product [Rotaria sp. Silwood2]CAF2504945.1 unnamed protein product [Rotaria sp. Silwood2]CAF2736084.1 unnamed protein product [Rotaria sp. Silwood2]CAF2903412.1 unnamed protein product [Rotaria sp. Silwood2]CAF4088394.1 unnamed protein product [Rotaria sp. Silwood2]
MSPKHYGLKATYSYQNAGFQSNTNDKKPQYRRTVSYDGYYTLEQEQNPIPSSSSSSSSIAHVSIPIPELQVPIIDSNIKNGRQRVRWNLIFNVLVWIICPLPLWLPFLSNQVAIFLLPSIQLVFVFIWLIIALFAARNAFIIFCNRNQDYSILLSTQDKNKIRHLVAISCYKEPLELIKRSIDTLAAQSEVNCISMIISFEERTPDVHTKCQTLQNYYSQAGFRDLIFTIHPYGLSNEIPGKCSNANYALRTAIKQLKLDDNENNDHILITTCDADSQFHHHYIAALTYQYIKDNYPALTTIYQPPLFYNWNLDASSFFTRVTGLLRSTLMLGALIPFSINTMSIFSFSLSLAKAGNFVHPAYQMDDIICLIRWMGVTSRRLSIHMVLTPVISGPTCGRTIEYEFMEWARQARRWTIGAAEVFHYFMVKSRRIPFLTSLSWSTTFLIYYGILLCSSGLYSLTYFIAIQFLLNDIPIYVSYAIYILISIQMLSFSIAFIIDIFIPRLLNINQCIFFLRNCFHFLMTPFVLIGYSLVEFYALHEVMIRGKKVCKHGASNKNTLN